MYKLLMLLILIMGILFVMFIRDIKEGYKEVVDRRFDEYEVLDI